MNPRMSRRDLLKTLGAAGLGLGLAGVSGCARTGSDAGGAGGGGGGRLNLADLGVGDPGSWAKFKAQAGWDVNLVAIGNAPSQVVNVMMGGGREQYHVVNNVGGMQRPLIENQLIKPLETDRLPNWGNNRYIKQFLSEGKAGAHFIGYEGKTYGFPTVLQGDSFAFLEEETGELNSYGALFDPKFRGASALEDNFTTTGQKTAMYLKQAGMATIEDPSDMTPGEIRSVIDFLIEKKKEGQFRTIWSSFNDAVNLLVQREVKVMDTWEPIVIAAQRQGAKVKYADPEEGYLLWAYVAYVVNNPTVDDAADEARYKLINFMGGPWYGATITMRGGYMTNPQAIDYAAEHPEEFPAKDVERIKAIHEGVEAKLKKGGTWQNRWPTHVKEYESQWARFSAAKAG